jgi:hypothetical protein
MVDVDFSARCAINMRVETSLRASASLPDRCTVSIEDMLLI